MTPPDTSSGLLVLGMHRSGTSALARVLNLCGADIGSRILGGSAGNESGHWEDAFAVEVHERLLAALGTRWDEALGLPADWATGEAGQAAKSDIAAYVANDRARQALWVVKDPRLSLFADLWIEVAAAAGQPLGTVLMLRHPMEVANSLAARDGIAPARGLLLWMEYSLAAIQAMERVPATVITYAQLLADWRACVDRIRSLPGGERLVVGRQTSNAVEGFLDGKLRHHSEDQTPRLPEVVREVWTALSGFADEGAVPNGAVRRLLRRIGPVRQVVHPLLAEFRVTQRKLWERVARAEAPLAEAATTSMPTGLSRLQDTIVSQHAHIVQVLSDDLVKMQETTAEAMKISALLEREAGLAQKIEPRLQAIEAGVAPLSAGLSGELRAVAEQVESTRSALVEAISNDLKRMQEVTTDALQSASVSEREAQLMREIAPRLQAMEAELLPFAKRIDQGLGMLGVTMEEHRTALAETISNDLRRMQDVTADALQSAAALEQEAALARQIAPRLQKMESGLGRLLEGVPLQQQLEDWIGRCAIATEQRERLEQAHAVAIGRIAALDEDIARLEQQSEAQRTEILTLERQLDDRRSQTRLLEHQALQLRADSAMLARVTRSRSWRMTRPLRAAFRLLTGNGAHEISLLRFAVRKVIARVPMLSPQSKFALIGRTLRAGNGERPAHLPDAAMAELVELKPPQTGLADVFVWSVIDWHFRIQRPQHLARAMAEHGHRVFYISNNFVDSEAAGFRVEPLDSSGRLFQVNLHLAGAPPIYFGMPSDEQAVSLSRSLAKVLCWSSTQASLSLVQHPYWSPLARVVPNARVVYDCMDHHAGFEDNAPAVLEAERLLLADADMVTVTSSWLERELAPLARATSLVRNAGEFDFFRAMPERVFSDPRGRKVIGYFGAIAEWFDVALVRQVAQAHPDHLVLLVGNDTVDAKGQLADMENVQLIGEVPYADLPYWLHGFDVALLPFRVVELTMATNPVKVYEYLAAGKPVVAVDLPEMAQFAGLVCTAGDAKEFVKAVSEVLQQPETDAAMHERQSFAATQTWGHRARAIDEAVGGIKEPLVSVVVLTYNNLAFTQNCLFSVEAYSDYPNMEVIVVDNASVDGSPQWLREWADEPSAAGHRRRLILNDANLGFSAGNNVGLAAANGEILVMLNNDTYVTFGWVRTLCAHLRRDPALGLIGPVTNNIGNEAKLDIEYNDIVEMHHVAGQYTRSHPGESLPLETAAFFCVAMPRRVYEVVGNLDEAFGIGFFEDDDYCRRVSEAGWRIACAEDVFVHHHLSASFDALGAGRKRELFEAAKAVYEAKWGSWMPHGYRPS